MNMDNILDTLTGIRDEITELIDGEWKYLSDEEKNEIFDIYDKMVGIRENCIKKYLQEMLTNKGN